MNIYIIQAVLDVFDHYGDQIRFDIERFEEALNDQAPQLVDECYLVVLGMKIGVYDAMIFDDDLDERAYVDYFIKDVHLSKKEAVFLMSVLKTVIFEIGYYFEVPQIDEILAEAYQQQDFSQLKMIAKSYFKGFGVSQDYVKAFEIYSYLYGHGDDSGAYYLGNMYEHGNGVEKNIEKALLYYQSRQDDMCDFMMGTFYMLGKYVEQNDDLAIEYLSRSHYTDAYVYLGTMLESQRKYADAFEAYYHGACLFQKECLYKCAMFLRQGLGVERDIEEAKCYFEYSYDLLYGESAYELSMFYFDGIHVEKNYQLALRYLHQAAKLYSQNACLTLAKFYHFGQYVKKNHQKSIYYYKLAGDIQEYKRVIMQESIEG